MSLHGKVNVINTLMGSLFVYHMSTMLTLTNAQLGEVYKEFSYLLWGSKRVRIRLYTLQRKKPQGGLRLVDLHAKQQTLKIQWIFKMRKDCFIQECTYDIPGQSLKENIFRCNLKCKDVKKILPQPNFWVECLEAWC